VRPGIHAQVQGMVVSSAADVVLQQRGRVALQPIASM